MGKYEKRLLKILFVFCQVIEKGTSELTQNAEFVSGGLMSGNEIYPATALYHFKHTGQSTSTALL